MRFQSYFNTAIKIIQLYDGSMPLSHFLKSYFSNYKKHGSKDRKFIAHICYNFYRLGKSFHALQAEEKLKIAIFICNDNTGEWGLLFDEEWLSNWNNALQKRIGFIQEKHADFSLNDVFPFLKDVSHDLDIKTFAQSFFLQPDVFVRIRPGYNNEVIHQLRQHEISFNHVDEDCIAIPSSININAAVDLDKQAVIQDYSSQRIKDFFKLEEQTSGNLLSEINTWDCCAGSGGKSILAFDTFQKIDLTVSDVRASIIQNLHQRFNNAGIKNYKSFVADVENSKFQIPNSKFDLIICDAPCTGSGTWSRTPEQLYFFQAKKINEYALLQQKIITNTIPSLKKNGYFLYITCSVFKKENEDIVDFIKQQFNLELIKMELLKGYSKKADTMFAALFKKTN